MKDFRVEAVAQTEFEEAAGWYEGQRDGLGLEFIAEVDRVLIRIAHQETLLQHREESDRRWWVEIVGFWTADYLQHKLTTYRAANLPRVILCIDAKRTVEENDLPRDARIIRFTKSISTAEVLEIIDAHQRTSQAPCRDTSVESGRGGRANSRGGASNGGSR